LRARAVYMGMTTTERIERGTMEDTAIVSAVREGDESAFTQVTAQHRRELHVFCYRMLGSFNDAEDMVQETYLRAWRRRETFEGRSTLRTWLYAIATHRCLDFLEARRERVLVPEPDRKEPPHVPWLQPYPDRLLDQPEAHVVARETIELAYLVAIQYLPPRQRAVLILRDVLDWSAKETAELLDLTVAAVNSALQRARDTMRERGGAGRRESRAGLDPDEGQRALLGRFVEATERGDLNALATLLRDDLRWSMPPDPYTTASRDSAFASWAEGGFGTAGFGDLRCILTSANGMPAMAAYLRSPGGTSFRPLTVDVLRLENDVVAEITTFPLEGFVEHFGLPPEL
jgi:RNA polymerase sigma-70 factor, ECF subfamily